jgi:uncharacterized protein (DUF1015 family)
MLEILPFRGIVYNTEKIGDLSLVVALPYDCISDGLRDDLYRRSPWNAIRLIAGSSALQEEGSAEDPYTAAARHWQEWLTTNVLIQDETPALYVCREAYRSYVGEEKVRIGLISLVRLEEFDSGIIRPHERTFDGPKADRLKLLSACRANFSQILGVYADTTYRIEGLINPLLSEEPDMRVIDDEGKSREVWRLTNPEIIREITSSMTGQRVVIADGHHRYETALLFRRQMREHLPPHEPAPCDYTMMYLTNIYGSGLQIAPIYRIISGLPDFEEGRWVERLRQRFTVERFSVDLPGLLRHIEEEIDGVRRFGAYLGSGEFLILSEARRDETLDVSVLHHAVIEESLGIDHEAVVSQRYLTYTPDPGEAVQMVDEDGGQIALFLKPVRPEEILRITDAGAIMPQKSTYFYPKLLTGFVMNSLE